MQFTLNWNKTTEIKQTTFHAGLHVADEIKMQILNKYTAELYQEHVSGPSSQHLRIPDMSSAPQTPTVNKASKAILPK